jgi:hypothetical protein
VLLGKGYFDILYCKAFWGSDGFQNTQKVLGICTCDHMSNYYSYSLEAVIVKSRAISVTGSAGLYGCEMFRI